MKPDLRESGARGYNPRGGRPPLDVDLMAVCDAVSRAWNGSGETITAVAARFGVSRAWIHANIYPVLKHRGEDPRDQGPDLQYRTKPSLQ